MSKTLGQQRAEAIAMYRRLHGVLVATNDLMSKVAAMQAENAEPVDVAEMLEEYCGKVTEQYRINGEWDAQASPRQWLHDIKLVEALASQRIIVMPGTGNGKGGLIKP
jgi:hypothetical protein